MSGQSWRTRLGAAAEEDFARILAYTRDTFGELQAKTCQATLIDAITALESGPDIRGSVARDEILPNLRTLHVARHKRRGRHFILYRASPGRAIDVIRILHDAMDFARHIPPGAE